MPQQPYLVTDKSLAMPIRPFPAFAIAIRVRYHNLGGATSTLAALASRAALILLHAALHHRLRGLLACDVRQHVLREVLGQLAHQHQRRQHGGSFVDVRLDVNIIHQHTVIPGQPPIQ